MAANFVKAACTKDNVTKTYYNWYYTSAGLDLLDPRTYFLLPLIWCKVVPPDTYDTDPGHRSASSDFSNLAFFTFYSLRKVAKSLQLATQKAKNKILEFFHLLGGK